MFLEAGSALRHLWRAACQSKPSGFYHSLRPLSSSITNMAEQDPIETSAETNPKKAKSHRFAKGKFAEGYDSRVSLGGRPEGFVRKAKPKKCALLMSEYKEIKYRAFESDNDGCNRLSRHQLPGNAT